MQKLKLGNSNLEVVGSSFASDAEVLPGRELLGIAFVPYRPLGIGFLPTNGGPQWVGVALNGSTDPASRAAER